ncbi:MAG: hypothetical protein LBF37_04015, partial [Rickettsiales bacterium]|nr:hypothetical protein [Rickettsiales bacterium]
MKAFKKLFSSPTDREPEVFIEEGLHHILYKTFVAKTGLFPNEELVTMNKKILWSMMFDVTDEKRLCADKYKARSFVLERIGDKYLLKELGVWDDIESIDFDALPEKFLLKLNVGAGKHRLVTNKSKLNVGALKKLFHKWFVTDHAFKAFEMQYYKSTKRLFCLEALDMQDIEFNVFVFHGKVRYIQASLFSSDDRKTGTRVFDENWNEQDFYIQDFKIPGDVPKPDCLDNLIEKSEILGAEFDFVRVDWQVTSQGELKFKEFVFSPSAGNIQFHPGDANNKMGGYWIVP